LSKLGKSAGERITASDDGILQSSTMKGEAAPDLVEVRFNSYDLDASSGKRQHLYIYIYIYKMTPNMAHFFVFD